MECEACGSHVATLTSEQTAKILLWLRSRHGEWTLDLTHEEATAVVMWMEKVAP
jgi:hypothetical protein